MENFINPTVRVSDSVTGKDLKKLTKFVEPFVGSPYIFIPITGDFIDETFREFQLIRCRVTSESAEKRDKLDAAIRRWCLNFGLENPVITW
jgi:hypothetical protein